MSEGLNGKYAPRPGFIRGVAINLGGHDLVLAPLNLRLAREFEAKGKELQGKEPAPTVEDAHEFNIDLILASLQRNYPDMTREALDALLDTASEAEAIDAVMNQSGLKRVAPGELTPGS